MAHAPPAAVASVSTVVLATCSALTQFCSLCWRTQDLKLSDVEWLQLTREADVLAFEKSVRGVKTALHLISLQPQHSQRAASASLSSPRSASASVSSAAASAKTPTSKGAGATSAAGAGAASPTAGAGKAGKDAATASSPTTGRDKCCVM
jgi:hypothetical protein